MGGIVASLSILFFGWLAHRWQMYGPPVLLCLCLGLTATACLQAFKNPKAQYGLTFLLGIGMFPATSLIICWAAANLHPATKRGVGIGIIIAMASCGGVLSAFIFRPSEADNIYQNGYLALMLCLVASFGICAFLLIFFRMRAFSQPPLEADLARYVSMNVVERLDEDLKGDRGIVSHHQR
jgi:MFS family permease